MKPQLQNAISNLLCLIYGLDRNEEKEKVWGTLSQKLSTIGRHMVILGGDFNVLLRKEEKLCGNGKVSTSEN